MYKFDADPPLTPAYILDRVSQKDIFEHYLGVDVQTKYHFCSPLRNDENPTCSFKWINGTLYFRDWAQDRAKNCFTTVQDMYGLSFNNTLKKIAGDMNLSGKNVKADLKKQRVKASVNHSNSSSKKKIEVHICPFQQVDADYLSQYGISKDTCNKFNVVAIDRVWLDDKTVWSRTEDDPALGYYFGKNSDGEQKWKIYYYKRDSGIRFIGNTNRINGWKQLPDTGSHVIITKSMKDVMALHEFSINAIALQNETTVPQEWLIEELKEKFEIITTLYDFDLAGISTANKIKRKYNIKPLFFFNGRFGSMDYGSKDFSDYVRDHGEKMTKQMILAEIEYLTQIGWFDE